MLVHTLQTDFPNFTYTGFSFRLASTLASTQPTWATTTAMPTITSVSAASYPGLPVQPHTQAFQCSLMLAFLKRLN